MAILAALQPKALWYDEGDSSRLMWGHLKVGEVSTSGSGTYYAYYNPGNAKAFVSFGDFIASDLARAAVEGALTQAHG